MVAVTFKAHNVSATLGCITDDDCTDNGSLPCRQCSGQFQCVDKVCPQELDDPKARLVANAVQRGTKGVKRCKQGHVMNDVSDEDIAFGADSKREQ